MKQTSERKIILDGREVSIETLPDAAEIYFRNFGGNLADDLEELKKQKKGSGKTSSLSIGTLEKFENIA